MLRLWTSEGLGPSLANRSGLALFGGGASTACSHHDTLVAKHSNWFHTNPPKMKLRQNIFHLKEKYPPTGKAK